MSKLEWNRSFALEQTAGDEELLTELVELFVDSSMDNLKSLKQAVSEENAEGVVAAAHSLKGASASLGIESVRQLVLAMETDARKGSITCAVDTLHDLENQLEEIKSMAQ